MKRIAIAAVRDRHRRGRRLAGAAGAADGPVARIVQPRSHAARVRQPALSACARPSRIALVVARASWSSRRSPAMLLRPGALPQATARRAVATNATTQVINRGEYLARAGDCVACHTDAERHAVRRRPGDAHAVRQPLRPEHHARRRDRHRQVDRRRVLPHDAHRHLARRHAALSGHAVRVVHQGHARGLATRSTRT